MKLKIRRLIYFSFIIIFFIVTPLTLLYTMGYRWNFYKNSLDKIGGLVIRTQPALVNIKINDLKITKKTPWRSNSLLPNLYQISITKPGYQNWQKQLNIRSGETTFAEHIYLFLNPQTPVSIITENIINWSYNDSGHYLIGQTEKDFIIYNLTSGQTEKITSLSADIKQITWSNDKQSALIETEKNFLFWRLAEPKKTINLNSSLQAALAACRWSPGSNDTVTCHDGTNIWQYSVLTNVNNSLLSLQDKIIDFYQTDRNLYYLEKNSLDQNIYLKINTNYPNNNQPDYLLPASSDYEFIRAHGKQVTILDKANEKLYLLNLYDQQDIFNKTSRIISEVKSAFYTDDNTLVYYNNWELWVDKDQRTFLITRQANQITQVLAYPSLNHLLVISQNGIKMIELDNRDKRNTAEIINITGIKKAFINKEADQVLFSIKQSEGLTGLFRVQILATESDVAGPSEKP